MSDSDPIEIVGMACSFLGAPDVGLTEDQAKPQGIKVKKGLFPWTVSGRAIANGRDDGVTKLLFDDSSEANCHGIRTLHHSYCATG